MSPETIDLYPRNDRDPPILVGERSLNEAARYLNRLTTSVRSLTTQQITVSDRTKLVSSKGVNLTKRSSA
jgi:hypothetical protein